MIEVKPTGDIQGAYNWTFENFGRPSSWNDDAVEALIHLKFS